MDTWTMVMKAWVEVGFAPSLVMKTLDNFMEMLGDTADLV